MPRLTLPVYALFAAVFFLLPAIAEAAGDKAPKAAKLETATFAAGCYWCTEADFDKVEGVVETISGFMGGNVVNPKYEQVTFGNTGHVEAVQIKYDPTKVSYQKLLKHYWYNVDPYDSSGQFCDKGSSYKPVIFVHNPEQRRLAEQSKRELEKSGKLKRPIVVPIRDATTFYRTKDAHQDFYRKHPIHYYTYRTGCGRDAKLRRIWGSKTN